MKRRAFKKEEREKILSKTHGRCGYCGEELTGRWNVDHMKSLNDGGTNDMENLMASCFPCNNLKHRAGVEEFRRQVENQIFRMFENVNYRTAFRFGLFEITGKKVVFYFERGGAE